MLLAAAVYFAFAFWLFFRADPATATIFGGSRYWLFHIIFVVILVPSALWMPLLFGYLTQPGSGQWAAVRLVLVLAGIGSLALLAAIITVSPRETGASYWLALGGVIAFCVQTAVLDMLVWPALFRD